MTAAGPLNNQRGVTLMVVLLMVVVVGLAAGVAGSSWRTVTQREREQELLWRGDQYRRAIQSYYEFKHAGTGLYPRSLEDLLRDPRSAASVRHIRQLFPDPITGEDWVVIKDPTGRIKGVRSSSTVEPFKKSGFPADYDDFQGRKSYAEWEFVFLDKTKGKTTQGGAAAGN